MSTIFDQLGPTFKKILAALNYADPLQLLDYIPVEYRYYSQDPIEAISDQTTVTFFGEVLSVQAPRFIRANLKMFTFEIITQGETMEVVVFNQIYYARQLVVGRPVIVVGRFDYRKSKVTASKVITTHLEEYEDKIVPRYPLPPELKPRIFRKYLRRFMDICLNEQLIKDRLPAPIVAKRGLISREEALEKGHFPVDEEDCQSASKYLRYETFLIQMVKMRLLSLECAITSGISRQVDLNQINLFKRSLPYSLTPQQVLAIDQMIADLSAKRRMFRLLQGEVSSGKTVVALTVALGLMKAGYQVAFMAPTDLLARQIKRVADQYYQNFNVSTALLVSSLKKAEKEGVYQALLTGSVSFVVGTHALLSEKVAFPNLGLVIIDEQHRFGVAQRSMLAAKMEQADTLIMSATPIPRTMAMIMYGDTAISTLQSAVNPRQVTTEVLVAPTTSTVLQMITQMKAAGQQVFLVCPLITESLSSRHHNVEKVYQDLTSTLPPEIRLGYLHSRLSSDQKNEIIEAFANKAIDVLVTTIVIEVGIDLRVSNMIILDAECFGLATLHQLRGRVGRDGLPAKCYLVTGTKNPLALERLNFLTQNSDGFVISQYDLEHRGPGELLGTKQSGTGLTFDSDDLALLSLAQDDSLQLIESKDPEDQAFVELVKNLPDLKL